MRIDENKLDTSAKIRENKKNQKKATSTGSDFDSLLSSTSAESSNEAEGTNQASGASPTNPFLALQELEPREEEKREFKEYSEQMFEALDSLKLALLEGNLSKQHLKNLQTTLEKKAGDFKDPKIKEACKDLQLRAAVELAKFERS